LLALLLLVVSPLYLTESQTLQADAPSTALMLLALGLAYLWWDHPVGLAGYALAVLTASMLALSILSKLFGLADLVPIGLLVLAHLWRTRQQPARKRLASSGSLLAGACALLLTGLLFIVPFSGSFSPLWDQVITFHTAAKAQSATTTWDNLQALLQVLATPLGAFAFYGALISLVRRDWHVLPLIAWFFAIFCLLWQQLPLFPHHLVTLVPPLVLLAMMSLLRYPRTDRRKGENLTSSPDVGDFNRTIANKSGRYRTGARVGGLPRPRPYIPYGNGIAVMALCLTIVYVVPIIRGTYQRAQQQAHGMDTQMGHQVARDLDAVTRPDQLVITDAPFLAAEANRSTPPQLVDTSLVRIQSGYLSNAQLIQISRQERVHAVLFYTGRLYQMGEFYLWVSQHFRKVQSYGNEQELWAKME